MSTNCDFAYHSYFSLVTETDSRDGFELAFNPFDNQNYSSTYNTKEVNTPDIKYDASAGSITVNRAGDYSVVAGIMMAHTGSFQEGPVVRFKKNGSNVAVFGPQNIWGARDPRQSIGQSIVSFDDGDTFSIEVENTDSSSETGVMAASGSYLFMVKANGPYGFLGYSADAAQTATTGRLEPSLTRKYLCISTLYYTTNGATDGIQHKIAIDGSAVDEMTIGNIAPSADPVHNTFAFLKEVANDEAIGPRRGSDDTKQFTPTIGTSFSIVDISNNGIDPDAYLSFSVVNDSSDLGANVNKSIFKAANYGSFETNDHVTATNITFNSADGSFTVSLGGDYLVLLNMDFFPVDADKMINIKVLKNDVDYHIDRVFLDNQSDPQSHTAFLIMTLAADDVLNFKVDHLDGKIDDGSSITIIKLDNVREIEDINLEAEPNNQIAGDFTLNTFGAGTLTHQHKRITDQVPFTLGIPGPLSLRGKCFGTSKTPANVSTGDKKN